MIAYFLFIIFFSDPVIPKKETFIKAKYLNLAYTIRSSKDEENTLLDLNRQLWSCGNLLK